LTFADYVKDPLAKGKHIAKQASHVAVGFVAKKVAMNVATTALAATVAAPLLPFITAGSTILGIYHLKNKIHDKYDAFYQSDPSALLPLECEFDPVVPPGADTSPIGTIEFYFGSAKDLKAMDHIHNRGSSDPYCRIYLNDYEGKHYRAWQTGLQSKTLNPHWEIPPWSALYLEGSSLTVALWDKDLGRKDDFLGVTTIPLDELFSKNNAVDGDSKNCSVTVPLTDKEGEEEGKWGSISFAFRFKTEKCSTKGEEDHPSSSKSSEMAAAI